MLDTRDRGCRLAWVGSFLPELLSTLTGHHPQALELIWTRVSTDKNIRYQQNLSNRKLALVVLSSQQWPDVQLHLDKIAAAVIAARPGSYVEVEIPRRPKVKLP